MTALDIFTQQLDDLRIVTLTDGEAWSARDLMPFAGYDRWENFSKAINRAIISVNTSGIDASDHFRGVTKMVEVGSGARRQIEDLELTKHACFVIFQNADGSKPEIAAIQKYFAVTVSDHLIPQIDPSKITRSQLAQMVIDSEAEIAERDAQIAVMAPLAAHAEIFRGAEGLSTVGDVANRIKVHAAMHFPAVKILHEDVRDHAARLGLIIRGDTIRNNQPTAKAIEAGWVRPHEHTYDTTTRGPQTNVSARLTPKGEARLFDGVLAYLGQHGSLKIERALHAVSTG